MASRESKLEDIQGREIKMMISMFKEIREENELLMENTLK